MCVSKCVDLWDIHTQLNTQSSIFIKHLKEVTEAPNSFL